MAKKTASLLPPTDDLLCQFGARLRVARLRRRLPAKQVAERSGMSPMTLRSLERGGSGVTMGAYLAVMQVLGIETDLNLLAKADPMGRELQDARLPTRAKSATRRALFSATPVATGLPPKPPRQTFGQLNASGDKTKKRLKAADAKDWIEKGGFLSADTLADLIEPASAPLSKKRR